MGMVAQRKRTTSDEDRARDDWPRLLSFAALFAAVLGVLLLGAVLRTDRPREAAVERDLATAPVREDSVRVTAAPTAAPRELADEGLPPSATVNLLAARAATDLERLAAMGSGWTAQLAVLCDRTRVTQLLERFGEHAPFYVLPSLQGDSACFRICWNRYTEREAAQRAADLPPALREIESRPLPKAISEVVQ
jgi:septal ring-binding cell division protein DamX